MYRKQSKKQCENVEKFVQIKSKHCHNQIPDRKFQKLQNHVLTQENQNRKIIHENEKLRNQVEVLKKEKCSLQYDVNEKEKIIDQIQIERINPNELSYYKSELSRKNDKEKQMKCEIVSLQKEVLSLQSRIKSFENDKIDNQNFARKVCELENEKFALQKELFNKKQEICENQNKISDLQEANSSLKKEICHKKQENCENHRNLSDLQEQFFNLKKDFSKKDQEICDQQRKLFKIEEENFQLKNKLSKRSKPELPSRISELEADVMSLKRELSKKNEPKTIFSISAPIVKSECHCKGKYAIEKLRRAFGLDCSLSPCEIVKIVCTLLPEKKTRQRRIEFSAQYDDSPSDTLSENLRILGQEIRGLKKSIT